MPRARQRPGLLTPGCRTADWKADWIRRPVNAAVEGPDQYTYARKEVRLDPSPIVRARADVSADQQYELYVNGVRAGKGEAYSYPDEQYYETLDVTRLLRAGDSECFGPPLLLGRANEESSWWCTGRHHAGVSRARRRCRAS